MNVATSLQLREQQAEAGDIVLLYGDESEALTHPYLARARAKMAKVPSAKPVECHRRGIRRRSARAGPWTSQESGNAGLA